MCGVTVIDATMVLAVKFTAGIAGISPTPDAGIPIEGLLFVQVKVAPAGVLVKLVAGMVPPLQKYAVKGTLTVAQAAWLMEAPPVFAVCAKHIV